MLKRQDNIAADHRTEDRADAADEIDQKRTILSARSESFETQLEHEAQALAELASSEDVREGLSAFAARRKPEFKSR
ncbi:MAG: hypothetical protein F9K19_06150 [Rhizobiaceae bacterium]|nr:MAG: hypothetical protein F9K19_06150 [Rhizobiaceae bacterium]